jgi:hypothetical protein
LIVSLLGVQGLLLLSARFQWFAFNEAKGWTVLIAMAVAGLGVLALLVCSLASYFFKWQFQFSIRSLVTLILVTAIPCCWFAVKRRQASRQQAAFKVFRAFPGIIRYDFELPSDKAATNANKPLIDALGNDFFADVKHVCLGRTHDFTDEEMAYIQYTPDVRFLSLNGAAVSDDGVKYLESLQQLEHLSLSRTLLTDVGLESLETIVTLQRLYLMKTAISDAGLIHLRPLVHLELLHLADNEIGDAGLAHVKGLTSLRSLYIQNTKVTDAGLQQLRSLSSLETLDVRGTQVTQEGASRFKKALPNCRIKL